MNQKLTAVLMLLGFSIPIFIIVVVWWKWMTMKWKMPKGKDSFKSYLDYFVWHPWKLWSGPSMNKESANQLTHWMMKYEVEMGIILFISLILIGGLVLILAQ